MKCAGCKQLKHVKRRSGIDGNELGFCKLFKELMHRSQRECGLGQHKTTNNFYG